MSSSNLNFHYEIARNKAIQLYGEHFKLNHNNVKLMPNELLIIDTINTIYIVECADEISVDSDLGIYNILGQQKSQQHLHRGNITMINHDNTPQTIQYITLSSK